MHRDPRQSSLGVVARRFNFVEYFPHNSLGPGKAHNEVSSWG